MGDQLLGAVEDALAAYRLVRLVTTDSLVAPARDAVVRHAYLAHGRPGALAEHVERTGKTWLGKAPGGWTDVAAHDHAPPKLAELITCRWCTGVWVGAGVVVAHSVAPRLWAKTRRALALAAVAALAARLEG